MSKVSFGLSLLVLMVSCSESKDAAQEPVDSESTDSNTADNTEADAGSGEEAEPECFENPTTHFEIINACTDSIKVKKTPNLKLLDSDGALPPP